MPYIPPYNERALQAQHPLAKQLLQLLAEKETNLAVAADVTHSDQLLELATTLGPEICILKTHIDILTDFSPSVLTELTQLAKQHRFLILEDRKFADIGNTVAQQYRDGIYHIADWAQLITAHSLPGSGIIDGLKSVAPSQPRGCLLLAEMSSAGNLLTDEYVAATLAMAQQHPDFVVGFIAQRRLLDAPDFITLTPGVSFATAGDKLGQRYIDPHTAVKERGTDIIIVGRAIITAPSPRDMAQEYRVAAWQAYQQR